MTAKAALPKTRKAGKFVAALALTAGVAAGVTVVAPTAASASTCRPTNLDGNWYSTDPDAYITRISVENLSCTTGGSGFAVHIWAHHWLGLHPGEADWGTTRDVTSGSLTGITTANYYYPNAWTSHVAMIPDYDGYELYVVETDDYVNPDVDDYVWPRQTFVH